MFRNVISLAAYYLGIWRLIFWAENAIRRRKILVVFTFHRIAVNTDRRRFYLEYDRGLDAAIFELHLQMIKKYFRIITLDEFLDYIGGRSEPCGHAALITFDDADREFMDTAVPVLGKYNMPAVVFAPTGFIGTDARFWHLYISNLFLNLNQEILNRIVAHAADLPDDVVSIFRRLTDFTDGAKEAACRSLVNVIDGKPQAAIDLIVEKLVRRADIPYTLGIGCMNWPELKKLSEYHIDVESHADSHRKLAMLPPEIVGQEMNNSREIFQRNLGRTVRTICYPAGSFNDLVITQAEASGYEAGFTTQPGLCRYPLWGSEKFAIPRYATYGENKFTVTRFLGLLAVSSLLDRNKK